MFEIPVMATQICSYVPLVQNFKMRMFTYIFWRYVSKKVTVFISKVYVVMTKPY